MESTRLLTAIIEREGDAYVALCPELDIASQGQTVETARTSLIEALELFFESADRPRLPDGCTAKCSSRASRSRLGKLRVLSAREVCQILEGQRFSAVRQRGSHIVLAAITQLWTAAATGMTPSGRFCNWQSACWVCNVRTKPCTIDSGTVANIVRVRHRHVTRLGPTVRIRGLAYRTDNLAVCLVTLRAAERGWLLRMLRPRCRRGTATRPLDLLRTPVCDWESRKPAYRLSRDSQRRRRSR